MPEQSSKVLTVLELAELFRVKPCTIYRLLKRKQLPAFRIGSDWRFNQEAIEEWCQLEQERTFPKKKSVS